MTAHAIIPSSNLGTPETYLNPMRAQGLVQPLRQGVHSYSAPGNLGLNEFALGGTWDATNGAGNSEGSITSVSSGASIEAGVQARNVYLVMTSPDGAPRSGRVFLAGQPIPARFRGTDVGPGGYFTVRAERLYNLVRLPQDAQLLVKVELPPGVSAYDFTFG
jgi:hypothetical protein